MDRNVHSDIDNYFGSKIVPLMMLVFAVGALGGMVGAFLMLWFIST
jgi:hypothetical protein